MIHKQIEYRGLIIKQTPHATVYHTSFVGDESYMQESAESSIRVN